MGQLFDMKSVILGAGVPGGIYPGFTPFSYEEIEQFNGIYMLQGLDPSHKLNGNLQANILTQSMAVIFATMSLERTLSNSTANLKLFLYPGSKQTGT